MGTEGYSYGLIINGSIKQLLFHALYARNNHETMCSLVVLFCDLYQSIYTCQTNTRCFLSAAIYTLHLMVVSFFPCTLQFAKTCMHVKAHY